jgi:hypothetical protein
LDRKILKFDLTNQDIRIKKILQKDFLELEIDAISTANPNRNGSHFTKDSLIDAIPTCYNKPILGYFDLKKNDFDQHNYEINYDKDLRQEFPDHTNGRSEVPLGLIKESSLIEVIEKNGENWLKVNCAIWTAYSYKQVKNLLKSKTKKVSVEIMVLESYLDEKGIEVITKFSLSGISVLGDSVAPGIEGAHLTILEFLETEVFAKQKMALNFAYNELDNEQKKTKDMTAGNPVLHIDADNSKKIPKKEEKDVTYNQKREIVEIYLSKFKDEDDNCCYSKYYVCDMADSFVIIRDCDEQCYFKVPYSINEEEDNTLNLSLDNKTVVLSDWVEKKERFIEIEGENIDIDTLLTKFNEQAEQLISLNDQINNQSVTKEFVTIDEVEYDVNSMFEKYTLDLENKNTENFNLNQTNETLTTTVTELNETVDGLNQKIDTYAELQNSFDTLNATFAEKEIELTAVKQEIFKLKMSEIEIEALKMAEEEDIDEEDKKAIELKCQNSEYSSIEEVQKDVAFASFKKRQAKKENMSKKFESNIIDTIKDKNTNQDKKNSFDKLKDFLSQ